MSITYKFQTILRDSNGTILMDKTVEVAAGSSPLIDETIAQNQTNKVVTFQADASALKGFVMVADKDCTVCTNDDSGGTPAHTWTLLANEPMFWHESMQLRNPLYAHADFVTLTDITDLRVTTGAAVGNTQLQVWPLQDPTP